MSISTPCQPCSCGMTDLVGDEKPELPSFNQLECSPSLSSTVDLGSRTPLRTA
jgi:hypothetical protein